MKHRTYEALLSSAAAIGRSLRRAAPTLFAVLVFNFILIQLMPGDAADVLAGESGQTTEEIMAQLRAHFGLDVPAIEQFYNYIVRLAHLDLGISPRFNVPVHELILDRLPHTLLLMVAALAGALATGLLVGTVMAYWRGRWPDRVLSFIVLLLYSTPGFWIGLMMIIVLAVKLGWFPIGGNETIGAALHGRAYALDVLHHLVLPATAVATFFTAIFARLTRASVLDIKEQDFVRTAHAKGVRPGAVAIRHVLRNALIPVTTMAGMHFGTLMGGAVVAEVVFGRPGLGRLAYDAVQGRDYVLLLGILLVSSLIVIVTNVVVDAIQAWLDPRVLRN